MNNKKLIEENIIKFIFQYNEDKAALSSFHLCSSLMLKERTITQVANAILELEDILKQGLEILKAEIALMNSCEKEKALKSFQQIILLINDWELEEKNTNLTQIPIEICDFIYQIGRELLLRKNYEKATRIFSLLLTLRSDMDQIWLGFAIAEQYLGHFEIAKMAYLQVLFLDPFHEYSKRAIESM